MEDNDYLADLITNIEDQISQLNRFESEVLARPNTDDKSKLLQTIKGHRDKLSELASSTVLPSS